MFLRLCVMVVCFGLKLISDNSMISNVTQEGLRRYDLLYRGVGVKKDQN